MTSQPALQTIAIHILPNILQSRCNQTIKFGQLVEYNKRNIFLQKLCGKRGKKTIYRPLKKLDKRWKQVVCSLVSTYFDSPQLAIQQKQTV